MRARSKQPTMTSRVTMRALALLLCAMYVCAAFVPQPMLQLRRPRATCSALKMSGKEPGEQMEELQLKAQKFVDDSKEALEAFKEKFMEFKEKFMDPLMEKIMATVEETKQKVADSAEEPPQVADSAEEPP